MKTIIRSLLLLVVMAVMPSVGNANSIDPWVWHCVKDGGGSTSDNDKMSYNTLPSSSGGMTWYEDVSNLYGCGYQLTVGTKKHKDFSFSIYKLETTVLPYTKKTYDMEYQVCTATTSWRTLATLYYFETLDNAKSAVVLTDLDNTLPETNNPTNGTFICSTWSDSGEWKYGNGKQTVVFDNTGSSTAKTFTRYMLLAFTNDRYKSGNGYAWAGWKTTKADIKTTYSLTGSGTTSDPFQISSVSDLEKFRDMVNGGGTSLCAKLTANLDMNGHNWLPIGRYVSNKYNVSYSGTFDGNGFIISNLKGDSKEEHDMCLIGRANGCTIKNLILDNIDFKAKYRAIPFSGSGSSKIENCGVTGNISLYCYDQDGTGGCFGISNTGTISNSYTVYSNITNKATCKNCYYGSDATFMGKRGDLCYLLNNGLTQNPTWVQNIGTHNYPVQRNANIVYKTGIVYHNGKMQLNGSGSTDDPFMIATDKDLKYFADLVSLGYNTICVKLETDIDYTSYQIQADMIGTATYPYSGTFLGAGHSIKMAFSSTEEYPSLFHYTKDANIGNITLLGSVSGDRTVSGLIGYAHGVTNISHVINKVVLNSSHNGDAAVAGFIAKVGAGGSVVIANCGFLGKFNGPSSNCNGGFVGWLDSKAKVSVTSSFFAPEEIKVKDYTDTYTFVRYNSSKTSAPTITNCYYLTQFGTKQGSPVDETQMKSGELCFLLNNSSNDDYTWLQTLGTDSYPTLWESKPVYRIGDGSYSNNGVPLPGSGTLADPLLIGSPTDLELFRDYVNSGYPNACARLTADIDMSDRMWLPIGRYTEDGTFCVSYTGTFDGDGFVISNLSGRSETDHDMGLIGRAAEGCVIKDLIMNNVKLIGLYRCAPIYGFGTAKVEYCASIGILKFECSKSQAFGGICGNGSVSNMTGCYTVYENLSDSDKGSKGTNYCNVSSGTMAASGELCYKLNAASANNYHWHQTIGTDPYPMLRTGKKVAYDSNQNKYYNIDFTSGDNTQFDDDLSSNDLKIIHHGGRLYEFVITLGTKDGQGEHPYPDMNLSYKYDGSWKEIAQLKNINREKVPFTDEWSGEITYSENDGVFINPHTFQKQTPVFWIMQGNHSSYKATSLLWMAPEGMNLLKMFKIETLNTSPVKQITSVTQPSSAPTGANTVTVTTPTMNVQGTEPGGALVVMTTTSPIYSLGIWDATDNQFISTQEIADGAQNANIALPQQDCIHDMVALMYARQSSMVGTAMDTTYVTYGVPFNVKPIHSIRRTNASSTYNNTNNLRWAIAFPNDSDLMDNDQLVLTRAYKQNFSDATQLKAFALTDYTSTSEENDTLMGWYSYKDDSAEALSTSERYNENISAFDQWDLTDEAKATLTAYKYPARYVYYNIERATVAAIWSDTTKYSFTWKVLLTNVLPKVDSIKVIKTDDWATTHRVKLRLTLQNPYPEDLVPAGQKAAVMTERQKQGFTSRMFAWDEKAQIIIKRFSKENEWYQGFDEVAETLTVSGSDVKWDEESGCWYAEIIDTQTAPYTHYYYSAQVDNSQSEYPICLNMQTATLSSDDDANECYSRTLGKMSDFKASQGEYIGKIDLSWQTDETPNATLTLTKQRYQLAYDPATLQNVKSTDATGASEEEQKATTADDGTSQSVIQFSGNNATDSHALAAQVEEYTLKKTMSIRGQVYSDSIKTFGYSIYRAGRISGHVRMPDGMAFPGKPIVTIKLTNPTHLQVNDVLTRDKEAVIMNGYTTDNTTIQVETDETGYYEIDSLCYYGTGIQYTVSAECGNASFTNTTGAAGGITLTLEDTNREYTNVDFTCSDTHQFSGRILYEGSTVPVRDMEFYVNGQKLVDTDGKAIVTDATGNFSFSLPKSEVEIQARKTGHTLSGDGFILGGAGMAQQRFTPTQDYDGLLLTDSTKIRLVGRVAGGDVEGGKTLGFGESKNILGDSITLVLQLEGDNTSYIYYNRKNPDERSKNQIFSQNIYYQNGNVSKKDTTNVSFQSKRIVIKADNQTGEFCLDLVPARYKLAQIYANGYGTLYQAGEGIQIIDLTDSTTNKKYIYNSCTTSYCASFNKTYHSPARLTIRQTDGGSSIDLYGEKHMTVDMVTGSETMTTAWMEDGAAHYTFGYPVFKGGTTYNFLAEAFEEYRYNNSKAEALNTVPVGNRTLTITNGLDSNAPVITGSLNDNGCLSFSVTPSNTTFSSTGEAALMTLGAAVDVDGYSYEAATLKAYVTGARDMGVEVQAAVESEPQILDYIRDPYGATSYAYREKGTQYNWTSHYEKDYKEYFDFSFTVGVAFITNVGLGMLTGNKTQVSISSDLNWVTEHTITQEDGEYQLTLTDRMSTSNDPYDVGAMADLYVGSVSTIDIRRSQEFNVINDSTYQALTSAVKSGAVKVIAQGKDASDKNRYLVVADGLYAAQGTERAFIYSQKYILGTLIPNLERTRDNIHTNTDSIAKYNTAITNWQNVIKTNEEIKVNAMTATKNVDKKSIAGAAIQHTEQGSSYYRSVVLDGSCPFTYSVTGGAGHEPGNKGSGNGDGGGGNDDDDDDDAVKNRGRRTDDNKFEGFGVLISVGLGGGGSSSITNQVRNYVTTIGGSGYYINTTDNSYIDVDIVTMPDSTLGCVDDTFKANIDSYESGSEYKGNKYSDSKYSGQKIDTLGCYAHNYVFIQRGGASRNPWTDADSTFFYTEDGHRCPLGASTLRIDNPKIHIDNPIVYNQPQDEAAVFTVHLSNETEINDHAKYLNPTTLYLSVVDSTNPDGAKITMDGQPLKSPQPILLDPGQSIVKTVEVERGGKPYNYDNIQLAFYDNLWSVVSYADLSVHYVPASSPVNLSMPADNWLINTLSQVDQDGRYYIPVQIDGFSTTQYDNFHHIELQYKKQTESDDQWVTLCSYYADKTLYDQASGSQKAMIEDPTKIANIKFYGEADPIEMKYDLRAVAFCRLGTRYVTRASRVVSGTKDTRCPEVFGKPKPTDGILGYEDVVSLPFTEEIAYNYLDETVNFSVQGYTNNSDADHSAYLYFPGTETQQAISKVERYGNAHDFSLEMMVKAQCDGRSGKASFLSFVNEDDRSVNGGITASFGYLPEDDRLFASFGSDVIKSEKLSDHNMSISSAMTHVALTYSAADSLVRFYVGQTEIPKQTPFAQPVSIVQGYILLGDNYRGMMSDICIWGITLSDYEVANKYRHTLSSGERGLVAYWPTDETHGNIIADIVNGADIHLTDVAWETPMGYSLRLDTKPVELPNDARLSFTRNKSADYTLAFWFRADAQTTDDACIFSAGGDDLMDTGMDKMRIKFQNNELVFRSEGQSLSFGATKSSMTASVWHHVAVSVNHSQNVASLFLDGEMVGQTDAENVGGIASSYIAFGDSGFVGNIDNVSLWGLALPASYIKKSYNTDFTGRELELLVNLDFEQQLQNDQGSLYVGFSPYNNVIVASTGKIEGKVMVDEAAVNPDKDRYAPVRAGTGLQNLPFTWSSTNNELQININKTDTEINNQQVNIVVRNVEDINGNPMKNPQMWSVYVNRNVLEWNEDNINIHLEYGSDTTFTVGFDNKSGRNLSYTIYNNAKWLALDNTMGSITPLTSDEINFNISNSVSPGTYSTSVYMVDEDKLVSKLNINLNVDVTFPYTDFVFDSKYDETMNVVAVVKKKTTSGSWTQDMNNKDYVLAFLDNNCVSITPLTVDKTKNTSYAFMNIVGNRNNQDKPIQFRIWDASFGQVYDLEAGTETVTDKGSQWTAQTVSYCNRKLVGTDNPIVLRTTSYKIQTIYLDKGWNWISLNIRPNATSRINDIFVNRGGFTAGDLIRVSGSNPAVFLKDGQWDGGMDNVPFSQDNVYQVYAQNDGGLITVRGSKLSDNDRVAHLAYQNGSTWAPLAYLLDMFQPINIALSDFVPGGNKAPAGTVIKSHSQFAVAKSDGTWLGSLQTLQPGEGYYVKRNGLLDSVSVKFTNNYVATSQAPTRSSLNMTNASSQEYATSMPVIADFKDGDYQDGDLLLALSGDKLIGIADKTDGLYFLTVNAENGDKIQFARMREGRVIGITSKGIRYTDRDVLGTLESPYLIDFQQTDSQEVYDITGIRYQDIESLAARRGIFIHNGNKILVK